MNDTEKTIFSIRPATVYVLTRMRNASHQASVETITLFTTKEDAEQVAQALAAQTPGGTVENCHD